MNTSGDKSVAAPVREAAQRQRTILLVDDEENILSSLKRLLRRDGYRILLAGGGTQGLEMLASNAVDVIVSDQRMPGMTGVEFLRQVKTLYPDTVRIVLSGYTELQSITDAINEGAIYKFLTKPWDDELLLANILEAFTHKELADENRRLGEELTVVNQQLRELLEEKQRQLQRDEIVLGVVQEILQVVPLPIIGLDDEGMIVCANQEADSLFGHGAPLIASFAEDVLPQTLLEMLGDTAGDVVWQSGAVCWRASYRCIGTGAGTRGRLLILNPVVSV